MLAFDFVDRSDNCVLQPRRRLARFRLRIHYGTVVPHFNYEWIYDTRNDDWARTLWTLGAEVTQNDHFRYELYFARQVDRLPEDRNLNAIGVVFKWYY